jgi:hypothetical protein
MDGVRILDERLLIPFKATRDVSAQRLVAPMSGRQARFAKARECALSSSRRQQLIGPDDETLQARGAK